MVLKALRFSVFWFFWRVGWGVNFCCDLPNWVSHSKRSEKKNVKPILLFFFFFFYVQKVIYKNVGYCLVPLFWVNINLLSLSKVIVHVFTIKMA